MIDRRLFSRKSRGWPQTTRLAFNERTSLRQFKYRLAFPLFHPRCFLFNLFLFFIFYFIPFAPWRVQFHRFVLWWNFLEIGLNVLTQKHCFVISLLLLLLFLELLASRESLSLSLLMLTFAVVVLLFLFLSNAVFLFLNLHDTSVQCALVRYFQLNYSPTKKNWCFPLTIKFQMSCLINRVKCMEKSLHLALRFRHKKCERILLKRTQEKMRFRLTLNEWLSAGLGYLNEGFKSSMKKQDVLRT